MKRIPPSGQIKQEISHLLQEGAGEGENVLSQIVHRAIQLIVQEALEKEAGEFLGRAHYERRTDGDPRGYRNGYESTHLKTAEGKVAIRVPQTRQTPEPFRSDIMPLLKGRTEALQDIALEMYARGLSTRDIEDIFSSEDGHALLSRTAMSELSEQLWEEYEAFCARDLSSYDIVYLFADAAYEMMREWRSKKEGILVAWAILRDGTRVLLHLALGNKESYESWLGFFRDMQARGLKIPVSVTSDGAPGAISAIEGAFSKSLRIRCQVHKKRNVLGKVPDDAQPEIKGYLNAVYNAPTFEIGARLAEEFIGRFNDVYPSAVKAFEDDLEASLNHLKCPAAHRKAVRTTNLVERGFGEQKRRTKVLPRFFDEKSCLKLVFAALIRASERWRKIRMTEFELKQIERLRNELGQGPRPPHGEEQKQPKTKQKAA